MAEDQGSPVHKLEEVLDTSLDIVDRAEETVLNEARAVGFDEDDQHRIGIAVRECLVNGIRLSWPETRRPLVPLCSALARSTRGGPGAPRRLARHSRRRSGPLLARRSQAPLSGPCLTPALADDVIG